MSKERILSLVQGICTAFLVVLSVRITADLVDVDSNLAFGLFILFMSGWAFGLWVKGG